MGKGQSFQQVALEQLDIHIQKIQNKTLNYYLIPDIKINWK